MEIEGVEDLRHSNIPKSILKPLDLSSKLVSMIAMLDPGKVTRRRNHYNGVCALLYSGTSHYGHLAIAVTPGKSQIVFDSTCK